MDIIRIAKAEFIKIFKKPMIYIMGALLAFCIVISLLIFNPAVRINNNLKINGSNVEEMYNNFYTSNDVNKPNTFANFKALIENKKSDISIYKENNKVEFILNDNIETIQKYYNVVKSNKKENKQSQIDLLNSIKILNYNFNKLNDPNYSDPETKKIIEDYKQYEIENTYLHQNTVFSKFFQTPASELNKTEETAIEENSAEPSYKTRAFTLNTINKLKGMVSLISSKVNDSFDAFKTKLETEYFQKEFIDYFKSKFKNIYKSSIEEELSYININVEKFVNEYSNNNIPIDTLREFTTKNIKLPMENIKNYLTSITEIPENGSLTAVFALVNKKFINDSLNKINKIIEKTNSIIELKETDSNSSAIDKCLDLTNLFNDKKNNYKDIITNAINSLYFIKLDNAEIKSIEETYFTYANNNLKAIEKDIVNYYNNNKDRSNEEYKTAFNKLATKAYLTELYFSKYVDSKILQCVTNVFPPTKIKTLKENESSKTFSNFNSYYLNEDIVKLEYLLKNNLYDNDYLNSFAFNANSGFKTNAYDFMFFALRISAFLLIIFGITMAANLIAMEYENGTIKLLAIRPFKRYKLISGKILATMFFVFIFLLFSVLIAGIAGVAIYPNTFVMTPVLAIFNAQFVFAINPIILMVINIFSIFLEVLFYVIIAVAISTIFKSFTGAISTSILIFFSGFILTLLLKNSIWLTYLPFFNVDLFKYFGGFRYVNNEFIVNAMFTTPLLTNMNFYLSLGICLVFVIASLITTYVSFHKKEF